MKHLLLALVFVATSITLASADPRAVYKWEDPNTGTIHYTSKPIAPNAKPAKLPPITRGESKLPKTKAITCDSHGGIDCQAGADADGSAICVDGFKEANTRFKFACSSPKLEITDISELTENSSFTVFLRNARSVVARKPVVSFKPAFGAEVKLTGPEKVDAFGIAEFTLNGAQETQKGNKLTLSKKPDAGQITVSCENCS